MRCCHAVLETKNDPLESNKPGRLCWLRLREMDGKAREKLRLESTDGSRNKHLKVEHLYKSRI